MLYIQAMVNQENTMPYREKTAWLMLVAIAVTFGPYFAYVATSLDPAVPMPNFRLLGLYAIAAVGQVIIIGIGHLVLRLRNPDEARTPLDERDRAIKSRSISVSYYIMMFGMILVGIIMPFLASGWEIVNPAIATITIAEVVGYCITIGSYRKQA